MYIVLSDYSVNGIYRRKTAARRLMDELRRVINYREWPELAPRVVEGANYEEFAAQGLHYKELESIWFWLDRSRPVWGRVVLRAGG